MSTKEVYLASCEGKDQHTRKVAQEIAKRYGGKITAYKCRFCKTWHVGRAQA